MSCSHLVIWFLHCPPITTKDGVSPLAQSGPGHHLAVVAANDDDVPLDGDDGLHAEGGVVARLIYTCSWASQTPRCGSSVIKTLYSVQYTCSLYTPLGAGVVIWVGFDKTGRQLPERVIYFRSPRVIILRKFSTFLL